MADEKTPRERWQEWEEGTGFKREKGAAKPALQKWAQRKQKEADPRVQVAAWKGSAETGYDTVANGEKVKLTKAGKTWSVHVGGKSYELKSRRPQFGHAEAILLRHFGAR